MPIDPSGLTQRVKSAVLEGGAVIVGVADLTPLLAEPTPRPLTALAFGMRYPDPAIERLPDEDELARAIEGISTSTQRIYATVERLLGQSDAHVRCCRADALASTFGALHAPLSQKAVAALAGLGWIGKSSLLVTPAHGPRLRLGTLFTDASLLPDAPFPANHCGDCHLCREACPVGAVAGEAVSFRGLAGYRIDAQECRTHLERRGCAFCGLCLRACPVGR